MQYQIAIPSYSRPLELLAKTVSTLSRFSIDPSCITIFVVEDQLLDYQAVIPTHKFVVGVPGIVAQRQFIESHYPPGTPIVSIDDDIEDFDLANFHSLSSFITCAFQLCLETDSFIWGTYPVWNPFFRKNKAPATTHLNFICAAFYGFINRPGLIPITHGEQKEDVERSIRYFLHDGVVLRFNQVGFKTRFYSKGGLGEFRGRLAASLEATQSLAQSFPDLTSVKIRKNGMHEIVLKKVPTFKPVLPFYSGEKFTDDAEILRLLDSAKFHHHKRKEGRSRSFGEYYGLTLGHVKARISREIGLSAHTKKNLALYGEICRIGEQICPFKFEAIQVNKNVQTPPHKDANNSGLSCIIAFGEYEGLDLVVGGEIYDIKNRALIFDGAHNTHWNTPHVSGTKYSIIFFKCAEQ